MAARVLFGEQVAAGWLLILSAFTFLGGGLLYTGRAIWKWPAGQTHRYLLWERGLVIAALLVSILGLNLLAGMLQAAGDRILAPSAMAILLIGAAVGALAETYFLAGQESTYAPLALFVVLAFLGQALLGVALLRTGFLPAWVGWVATLWNLGWLVVLPIARPKDMYYPWLHYVAPLLIGIALLAKG